MPPHQQLKQQKNRAKTKNDCVWPTSPGSSSPHFQIPPPPKMNEIREAFAEGSVTVTNEDAATISSESPRDSIAAVAVEEYIEHCARVNEASCTTSPNQQSTSSSNQAAGVAVAAPSLHVPFMGYMDENGIVHAHSEDSKDSKLEDINDDKKVAATKGKKAPSNEEEKPEALPSVEDVLQASLNFEKSNPEKRFSSSLDNIYSSASSRNLYPSLQDFGEPESQGDDNNSNQQISDDSATTDELKSAAAWVDQSVVPEPPGTESCAIASATYEAQAVVEDEDDVKIGVARAEINRADTDSPAYAVAAVNNDMMEYASAEATVLGTSETPEEALLAKLAAEDAELIALKRSAYGGGYVGTPGFQATAAAFPDQQATVVSISEEYHPAEETENEAQAELIGEDYNDVPAIATPFHASASSSQNAATATHVASVSSASQGVYAVEEQVYAVVESEATVIYEGNGTWHSAHAEEATVLNDDSSVPYMDRKLPAVTSVHADEQSTPHRNHGCSNTYNSPYAAAAHPIAAVAEDSYWEGGQYYGNSSSVACAVVDHGAASDVDGGAFNSSTGMAYSGEQAEVVEISEDYHPAEVTGNEAQAELVSGAEMAYEAHRTEEQAEVVEISEEYHPAEDLGNEAQAELVAEDYGEAVAVHSFGGGERAQVVEISDGAARVDFVGEEYDSASQVYSAGVEASPLPTGVQAATVVAFEDESDMVPSPGISRANSRGVPVPQRTPPSLRSHTAPAAVGTRIDPVNTPLTIATTELDTVVEEADWMRTPTFSGDHGGVVVLQPPANGEAAQPAVAVVAAYADAPPVMDSPSCTPASTPQPALAVTSISAYATAPASPEFDDTDCSLVNRRAIPPETPAAHDTSTNSAGENSESEPSMPPPRSFNSMGNSDAESVASAAGSTSTTRAGFQKISNSFQRGMEMLFGDTKPPSGRRSSDNNSLAKSVMSRQLLPWSVIYSEATQMWVATVNTNQKALDSKNVVEASKSLRAFSVVTERQATCLAKAWSPPRMHSFNKNPQCHICKAKFAVFRRACHCRNCGVTICVSSNGCSRPWPAKMCPETYNIKKESFLNVCASCDFLCTEFRLALLEGDRDKAIALHATGNINLVTPFANVKGELFYPVHCAALGGNLELLKWLVDENCCPIKSVRVSGRSRDSTNSFTEISTSKGRSLLGIALENRNVGIVRYLIVEKGIQLSGEKDITMDTLCRNLELVLRLLPEDATTGNSSDDHFASVFHEEASEEPSHQRGDTNVRGLDADSDGSVNDACIICFDHSIDCVATPCGHQVCCLECGRNITRCPVCAAECSFMRVFRP